MSKQKFAKIGLRVSPKKVGADELSSICFNGLYGNYTAKKAVKACKGCCFCGDCKKKIGEDEHPLSYFVPCKSGDIFSTNDYGLGLPFYIVLDEDIIWEKNFD